MTIANYEDIKISIFYLLAVKLWLRRMIIYTQITVDIYPNLFLKVQAYHKILLSLSHNFAANQSNAFFTSS